MIFSKEVYWCRQRSWKLLRKMSQRRLCWKVSKQILRSQSNHIHILHPHSPSFNSPYFERSWLTWSLQIVLNTSRCWMTLRSTPFPPCDRYLRSWNPKKQRAVLHGALRTMGMRVSLGCKISAWKENSCNGQNMACFPTSVRPFKWWLVPCTVQLSRSTPLATAPKLSE